MVMLITLSLILVSKLVIPSTQAFDYFTNCTASSNYTQNSQYQRNLDKLLEEITSKASLSGFYYTFVGQIPDQVHGLYLCRGDMSNQGCGQCVYQAQGSILKECPTQIRAVLCKVKFGTTVANITSSEKLYTLGQCTLDLSASDCDRLTGA
ncbi:cysteine-rich repeat secretory protein 1-like [Spinacia oleracea]|uniref:Cysteine-rich repeat secretory protein 1-like n=1 Tax=Spinacia oleracea TaxID=3562 RepID=A0ABM3QX22_SPIOL|nr:cysteine-rich repeat secretory protein 1-like [Spinacia oleracea]